MDINSASSSFLDHCRTKGLSPHTLRAYQQDLEHFQKWAQNEDWSSKETIVSWMFAMQRNKSAPTTIKRRTACLKVMFRWLEENSFLTQNPFHTLRTAIQLPRRLPRNLNQQELGQLFGAPINIALGHDTQKQRTLFLALEILFATGVRVGELCTITLGNLDLEAGIIRITGKGNRERCVFLVSKDLVAGIRKYLKDYRQSALPSDGLLITQWGTTATPDYIRKALHALTAELSMTRRITPHMLRHTAATQLMENGVDIRFVQRLLGHASITTTEIYTHVSDQKLQETLKAANHREKIQTTR